ncbi:MAG: potassium-transporting ATPase subunit KdpB [Chlamydiae bacterium]|nr:potassium-transporting ATPase subunit KdpB [Chlamydiota bacterium]
MKIFSFDFVSKELLLSSLKDSLKKLNPKSEIHNPVMFVTYLGAALSSFFTIQGFFQNNFSWFEFQISVWLWFTVIFANFAEALAESRGKAQAQGLRKLQEDIRAKVVKDGKEISKFASELGQGDIVVCVAGDRIPADGEVIEGIGSVDESASTGESAPVIRESGGDRSAVTAGTKLLSDQLTIRITSRRGHTFLDRMIALIEGAKRQKTPNEIALNIVLAGLTLIFLLIVIALKFYADYSLKAQAQDSSFSVTIPILVALLVCLIPTTIGGLLSAIGISGIDRLAVFHVIAKSGKAIEAAGDADVVFLDKTGTITMGNRMASEFFPVSGVSDKDLANAAQLSSFADETPEGRSIMVLAKNLYGLRSQPFEKEKVKFVPFSAQTAMSGIDFIDCEGRPVKSIRKGSAEAISKHVEKLGGVFPETLRRQVEKVAKEGGTPLLVCEDNRILGGITLKDMVKGGIKERLEQLRKMRIISVMITGDNPLTAAAIAAESGVDDFLASASPEMKLAKIRKEQADGHIVAMAGDGTNDAPGLAQADVGVAMNTGTIASREAGNMIDLESNPTKLIEIVRIGKQLLMTRGALTTFSIFNDVAKYFAIIPALFGSLYIAHGNANETLAFLNIMKLSSPHSAILSAVIFNALIIVMLIPLAMKGISYRDESATGLIKRNAFVYGIGGLIAPFIGIKIIDLLIVACGGI